MKKLIIRWLSFCFLLLLVLSSFLLILELNIDIAIPSPFGPLRPIKPFKLDLVHHRDSTMPAGISIYSHLSTYIKQSESAFLYYFYGKLYFTENILEVVFCKINCNDRLENRYVIFFNGTFTDSLETTGQDWDFSNDFWQLNEIYFFEIIEGLK